MSSGHSLRWCEKYSQSHVACSSKDWLQLLLFSIARDCVRLKKKPVKHYTVLTFASVSVEC